MSAIWHPFTQHGLNDPIPLIERAEGATLFAKDGRRIIDAISSWWVTTHGHCHPPIMQAIAEQAGKLDQLIFAGFTHEPAEAVAEGLRAIMPPSLTRVFFSDSGSTAVEVALKMALGFWNHTAGAGRAPRSQIVVMEHSYHGDTIGAMSVGERGVFNQPYDPLLFDVTSIPFPCQGSGGDPQPTLDALETACADGAAALIVEPLVLGAGGMKFYSPEVLAAMRAICTRHGTLFIADEVMTGWGRTGTLLACEQADVVPDILCLSKGLTGGAIPLAVTMASEPIYEAHLSTDRAKMFFHSSSYTANPIACAAAAANLAIWRDEPVLERVKRLEDRLAQRVEALAGQRAIRGARVRGGIAAFELGEGEGYMAGDVPAMMRHCLSRGVLLRPLGSTIYAMPPFCITENELDRVFEAIATI